MLSMGDLASVSTIFGAVGADKRGYQGSRMENVRGLGWSFFDFHMTSLDGSWKDVLL